MRARSNLIRIPSWSHNPRIRKSRFRCQSCSRLVDDGSDLVIERRGRSSHGYHAACFDVIGNASAAAAIARDAERLGEKS